MSATLAPLPLPRYSQQQTQANPVPAQTCTCTKTAALAIEQGLTLSTELTLTVTDAATGLPVPVDVTGNTFQFTAKVDQTYSDDDPSTVKIDWQETVTPTQGITHLTIPAATTASMQTIVYLMQIRMKSSSGVVSAVLKGTLTIIEPISARF